MRINNSIRTAVLPGIPQLSARASSDNAHVQIWSHVLDKMVTLVSSRRLSDRRAGFLFVEASFTSSSRSCIVTDVVSLRRVALLRGKID